jgi:hypothetical protein
MDPSAKFPQHNMLPGHFLGIARSTGDSFTFIISQANNIIGRVLHRSVIRKRSPTILQTHADHQVPTLPTLLEVSPISDHDTMTSGTITDSFDLNQSLPNVGTIEAIVDTKSAHDGKESSYLVHLEPVQPLPLEHSNSIYDHFDQDYKHHDLMQILGIEHNPSTGTLYAKVQWKNLQESFIPLVTLQEEQPSLLANYILLHPVERTRSGYWNTWAQTTQKNISTVTRKLRRIHVAITQHRNFFPYCRYIIRRKKEYQPHIQSYLGVEIPRTVKEAYEKNKNKFWHDAIQREITSIQDYGTFEFLSPGSDTPYDHQLASLKMVFAACSGRTQSKI